MIFFKRRRFIFWVLREYLKKSYKTLIFSFLVGLLIFFALLSTTRYVGNIIPLYRKTTIGMVNSGNYTADILPSAILQKISRGLTVVSDTGTILPDLADSWTISKDGKTYTFTLKKDLHLADGRTLTSKLIQYNFSDVTTDRPNDATIVFHLHDVYAPFLVSVSHPVYIKDQSGLGEYKVATLDLNGNFLKSLRLVSTKNKFITEEYHFYPTIEALKVAFAIGEVSEVNGLMDENFKDLQFHQFPNTTVTKNIDYNQLVTLFFDTQDSVLSDKKLRSGLAYALPDSFSFGQRVSSPYAPNSFYFNNLVTDRKQDLAHARLLTTSNGKLPLITIKTLPQYKATAELIKESWKKIGVESTIEEVDGVPTTFQVYLGEFAVPRDPDQYTLWHSDQPNNITRYKNLRIDKLLEDGRKTLNVDDRQKIYQEFQKYLVDDAPAIFLYFPYDYTIERK